MSSLDIDEPQVLIHYAGDRIPWHHRILLRRLKDAVWLLVSPDGNVEATDLGAVAILALGRGVPLPAHVVGQCYLCGADVVAQLDALHQQAARLSGILGGAPAGAAERAGPQASWRIADTAAYDFGVEVDDELMNSHVTGVIRGAVGLCRCGEPARWVAVERVPQSEQTLWEQDKQSGAGRDRRLGVPRGHLVTTPVIPLNEAISGFRPRDLREVADWPHQGPRAALEFITAVQTLGLTLFTYHDFWVRQSGVHAESSVSWEHRMLCAILAMAICYDRLDVSNCASMELAGRRIIMIERAVRVNNKAPSFIGLHKMIEHALDEGGGIATREFTLHMATLAEAEARILKQNRLLREEIGMKQKHGAPSDEAGGGAHKAGKKKHGGGDAAAPT
jgi:hypothetical protein